jgi:hypothetical protein
MILSGANLDDRYGAFDCDNPSIEYFFKCGVNHPATQKRP